MPTFLYRAHGVRIRHLVPIISVISLVLSSSSCGSPPNTRAASDTPSPPASTGLVTTSEESYLQARADGVVSSSRVMFIGDSLLFGLFASEKADTWSSLVESRLQTETSGAELLPAPRKNLPPGTRTSTSSFDLSRIPGDLGLAVVELGTNDVSENVDLDVFATQYSAILDRIRETSPDSYLVCLSTWRPVPSYNTIISAACTSRVRASYVDIGRFYNEPSTRGPAGQSTPFGVSDDFHPNDTGHRAIADSIIEALS
jgi:acyl-CoA thioesterase-1